MQDKELYIRGDIKTLLIQNAIASLGGLLILSIDTFIDSIVVSKVINEKAFSALIILSPFIVFQSALTSIASTAISVLASKAIGEKDEEKIQSIFTNSHLLSLIASLLLIVLFTVFGNSILHQLSNDYKEIQYAYSFFIILAIATPIISVSINYGAFMRCAGQFKQLNVNLLISVIANILLAYILAIYFGIVGVATATVFSTCIYAALNYLQIKKVYQFKWELSYCKITLAELFQVGLSGFLFQVTSIIRQLLIIKSLYIFAANSGISIYGSVGRVVALFIIPAQAFIQAFQPIFAVNLSSEHYQRCHLLMQLTLKYSIIISSLLSLLLYIFPRLILNLFLDEITVDAIEAFRLCVFAIGLFPISALCYTIMQTNGNHKLASVIVSLREFVLLLPLLYFLNQQGHQNATYLAIITEILLYTIFIFLVMRQTFTKHLKLT